ncbi:unnamed protein product [Camellia sinensis]
MIYQIPLSLIEKKKNIVSIMSSTVSRGWVFVVVVMVSVLAAAINLNPPSASSSSDSPTVSLDSSSATEEQESVFPSRTHIISSLQYEFYREKCPQAEKIVRSTMAQILVRNKNSTAQLLRLFFHDCFIQGCDASVLLNDSNRNANHSAEKDATPNRTLKGFDYIDTIKQELEDACPGIVSCADILVLATRDAIVLAGGPFYPVFTGRRDGNRSYFAQATAEIPRPDGNISETLRLFALRGFTTRQTVALLGGHNIGKIGCDFIRPRLNNFMRTGRPDPSIPSDFLLEISMICGNGNSTSSDGAAPTPVRSRSIMGIALDSSISSGSVFDAHYYKKLLKGRGLLFADQQLMASQETTDLVRAYASDDGTTFRVDFTRAMVKMSNLGVLTGSQGQVRLTCSRVVSSNLQNRPW